MVNGKKNAVALHHLIDEKLNEIVNAKKKAGDIYINKVKVVADLITKEHKRECGK